MSLQHAFLRPWLRYAWAAPYSLVGLLLGLVAVAFGARARLRAGAMEFSGGLLGEWLKRLPPAFCFSAITFGHVILGTDPLSLDCLREHEHVHVRQYERWGLLYVPAYLLSSLIELLRGRNPYRDNYFEREAYARAPARAHSRVA